MSKDAMSFFLFLDTTLFGIVWIVYVFVISFVLWMIIDAAKNDRYVWIVITVGVPVLGAVMYYAVEKKQLFEHLKKLKGGVE